MTRHHAFRKTAHRLALAAVIVTTALLGGARSAVAQMDLPGPGAGFISVGASRFSTAELDDWLDARDYPSFGRDAVSIGIGGYRLLSSGLMLGLEAQGYNVGSESYGAGEMGLGAGYATLGAGYAIDLSPRVRVYPRVGVGAGGLALWVENEDTLAFEDVIDDQVPAQPREPNLARDGLVIDLGAGAEFLPVGRSGALIGVRAGWLMGPFSDGWEMYEHRVAGGPDASLSGPYVRVVVGWAWRR